MNCPQSGGSSLFVGEAFFNQAPILIPTNTWDPALKSIAREYYLNAQCRCQMHPVNADGNGNKEISKEDRLDRITKDWNLSGR